MYMTNLLLAFSEDSRKLRKCPREKRGVQNRKRGAQMMNHAWQWEGYVCLSLLTCLVVSVCEIAVRFTPIRPSIQIDHAN